MHEIRKVEHTDWCEKRHLNTSALRLLTWFVISVTPNSSSYDLVFLLTAVVELFLVDLVIGRPLISERSAVIVKKAKQRADMLREG